MQPRTRRRTIPSETPAHAPGHSSPLPDRADTRSGPGSPDRIIQTVRTWKPHDEDLHIRIGLVSSELLTDAAVHVRGRLTAVLTLESDLLLIEEHDAGQPHRIPGQSDRMTKADAASYWWTPSASPTAAHPPRRADAAGRSSHQVRRPPARRRLRRTTVPRRTTRPTRSAGRSRLPEPAFSHGSSPHRDDPVPAPVLVRAGHRPPDCAPGGVGNSLEKSGTGTGRTLPMLSLPRGGTRNRETEPCPGI